MTVKLFASYQCALGTHLYVQMLLYHHTYLCPYRLSLTTILWPMLSSAQVESPSTQIRRPSCDWCLWQYILQTWSYLGQKYSV